MLLDLFYIYYFSSKRGRRIRVQPTSVARRRGNYKGAHRINAGRPPTETYSTAGRHTITKKKFKQPKRLHNLTQCLDLNINNAKSH